MSTMVKAYLLEKDGSVKQIRKFEIDLEKKLLYLPTQALYMSLCEKFGLSGFTMYYKDEEGDLVAFSKDDELKVALACMKDNTLRVYIKENPTVTT